jgi:hypothetical protein
LSCPVRASARSRTESTPGNRAVPRPPSWRWLSYAIGFGLPARYDEWVFRDLTSRGWRLRELLRVECLALPFIVGIMFLPGSIGLRLMTALFFVVGPPFVAALYGDEWRDYRLRQHELLPPSERDPD